MARRASGRRKGAEPTRAVKDYRHEKKRPNNPPAGMVSYEVVREEPRQQYSYNPHLDPALQFDSSSLRAKAERLMDEAEGALAACHCRRLAPGS